MCKVLIVPGVKPEHKEKAMEFIKQAGESMSYHPDNDGFGYSSIYKDGSIFGEKWLKNADAFKERVLGLSDAKKRLKDLFGSALKKLEENSEPKYKVIGEPGEGEPVAFLVHARKKTEGDICLANTHPFFDYENGKPFATLIHNGTIKNHEKLADKKHSTCDSETILQEYVNLGMTYDMSKISELAKKMIGVYAVGILTNAWDSEKEVSYPILDMFKSNKPLYCGYIEELETYVYSTTEDVIKNGCRKAKLTLADDTCYELEDGHYFRIDAVTGDVLNTVKFTTSETTDRSAYTNYTGGGTGRSGNNHHRPNNPPTVVKDVKSKTHLKAVEDDVKKKFEAKHQSLFTEYFEVGDMSKEDQELMELLDIDRTPEGKRAIELVKMAVIQAG